MGKIKERDKRIREHQHVRGVRGRTVTKENNKEWTRSRKNQKHPRNQREVFIKKEVVGLGEYLQVENMPSPEFKPQHHKKKKLAVKGAPCLGTPSPQLWGLNSPTSHFSISINSPTLLAN
jgi:hypothetical protein